MNFVKCDKCNQEIKDWHGMVMEKKNVYPKMEDLKVFCKPCIKKIDGSDKALYGEKTWHGIWELYWFVSDNEYMREGIYYRVKDGSLSFQSFNKLVEVMHKSKTGKG